MKKYYGIDWLRVIACIFIILVHIAINNKYEINCFIYDNIISELPEIFISLFMSISAFGMCCGYFNRVLSGKINWIEFYSKRYLKTLPFFVVLIIIDLILNFNIFNLCEGIMGATLLSGFIPNQLEVVGVGWFLGLVFIFYFIFPFYCVLINNKRFAWVTFIVSIILNAICLEYFNLGIENFVFSFCFFVEGGLIYLYRDQIINLKWWISLLIVVLSLLFYFTIGASTVTRLFVMAALLIFSISCKCKNVKIISFLSSISLEIYLSHMVIFRGIEILGLNTLFGNGWGQYLFTFGLVFCGTVVFSVFLQRVINKIVYAMQSRKIIRK